MKTVNKFMGFCGCVKFTCRVKRLNNFKKRGFCYELLGKIINRKRVLKKSNGEAPFNNFVFKTISI